MRLPTALVAKQLKIQERAHGSDELARHRPISELRTEEPARRGVRRDEGVFVDRPKRARQGALDTKTKELIALGVSVAVRCDDCIAFHVKAAVDRGATREEILETLGMAIYMGAGPAAMYASHALSAYTQFAAAKADQA